MAAGTAELTSSRQARPAGGSRLGLFRHGKTDVKRAEFEPCLWSQFSFPMGDLPHLNALDEALGSEYADSNPQKT